MATDLPTDMRLVPDGTKLRGLARWFDQRDELTLMLTGREPTTEVQDDLRRIADRLDALDAKEAN